MLAMVSLQLVVTHLRPKPPPALRRLYNVIRVVIIEMIAESLDISVNVILDCGRRADEQTPPRCWAYSITREAGACRGDIQRIIGID